MTAGNEVRPLPGGGCGRKMSENSGVLGLIQPSLRLFWGRRLSSLAGRGRLSLFAHRCASRNDTTWRAQVNAELAPSSDTPAREIRAFRRAFLAWFRARYGREPMLQFSAGVEIAAADWARIDQDRAMETGWYEAWMHLERATSALFFGEREDGK
jgi:hypothetical protein